MSELGPTLLDLTDEESGEGEDWKQRLLVNLSCRTAVRRGRALDTMMMRALIQGLGQTDSPAVCPTARHSSCTSAANSWNASLVGLKAVL